MTLISTILLGVGIVFIASSLDCTPIISTFQKIINGQLINWSGNSANCHSIPGVPPTTQPGAGNKCPPGYTFMPIAGGTTGTCVKTTNA